MFEKLQEIENKYEELNKKLTDPEVISNGHEYGKIAIINAISKLD